MPLPSGTLTLLFTDIEGSTRMLERLGDGYAGVLTAHHAIVRDAVARHGGHEVATEGDAFFVVFERARDAAGAAAQVQRRLAQHGWPHGEQVRVRMGMHTGTPTLGGDNNYLGMVVHVAARICAAAHGGQVLISETTVGLLADALPDGAALRELGEHALKDIARPICIHQLVLPGLPDRFPPLRAQRDVPSNIPPADGPLIGRDSELALVLAALREGRLVTLTGPGGTGKTTLAFAAARGLLGELPGGAFFVDLVPVAEPAGILAAAAEALSVTEATGRTLEDALFDQLRGQPALLLLDNLEHLAGAGAPVAALLAACPSLKVLATSRVPLRLRAERELHVPPLATAAAAKLFVERARAGGAELAVDGVVEEICSRLDGLPLAIELAAARVRVLPPPALLNRLERRLPLLTSRAADLPARQRTLEATIAWSYDLLAPVEQRLFAVLGAFPGGWTFDAVAAAWGDDAELDVLDGIESLVEKSLLQPPAVDEATPRYGMLETVREFALARLEESGAADGVRARLAQYHAKLAEAAAKGMFEDGLDRWGPRLDAELDGIRATMAWEGAGEARLLIAGSLVEYFESRGALSEGRRWAHDALVATPPHPTPARALALTAACYFADLQGERDEGAIAELTAAVERIDDQFVRSLSLSMLGIAAQAAGDEQRGRALMRRAADEARGGSARMLPVVLNNLGWFALEAGRLDEARALLEEGIALCRGSRTGAERVLLLNLAGVALAAGAADDAERRYRDTLRSIPPGDVTTLDFVLEGLAWCRAAQGRAEEAARLLGAAAARAEIVGLALPGWEAAMHDAAVARVRAALGEDRLEVLWQEGRALPVDDALAYALGTRETPALAAAL